MGQRTSILNSKLAVQILSAIASRTDGDYSTNLADELDKSQPSISRILTELYKMGFIDKGRREKVQYYTINYDKIAEYWYVQIKQRLENQGKDKEIVEIKENKDKTVELASNFFQELLESSSVSNMTVSDLLFSGFVYSFGSHLIEGRNLLEENQFLRPILEGLKIYTEEEELCAEICLSMDKSIERTLE